MQEALQLRGLVGRDDAHDAEEPADLGQEEDAGEVEDVAVLLAGGEVEQPVAEGEDVEGCEAAFAVDAAGCKLYLLLKVCNEDSYAVHDIHDVWVLGEFD